MSFQCHFFNVAIDPNTDLPMWTAVAHLSFPGSAGATYDLQASQDLQQWETLCTTNCASDGPIVFDDPDMGLYPRRFYRLQQQ